MNTHSKTTDRDQAAALIRRLLTTAKADTLYWDLYLERARRLLTPLLSLADYRALEKERAGAARLPEQIREAMERADWDLTRELSGRLEALRQKVDSRRSLIELGQMLYDNPLVPVDPFSPGLQGFAGVTGTGLSDLQGKTLQGLLRLSEEDPAWKAFYEVRRQTFSLLPLSDDDETHHENGPLASVQLQQEALDAFNRGDFQRLRELSEQLAELGEKTAIPSETLGGESPSQKVEDFLLNFPRETLEAAAALGLVPMHADSWRDRYGHLCRLAWHPAIGGEMGPAGEAQRVGQATFPADTPEAMKERIRMFMIHPFISSGGSRYLPSLVAVDFLAEDFPDPRPGQEPPVTPLLEALGLPRRAQLSRLTIEQALSSRGVAIIEKLGLSPTDFRLVCIPPDLHLRAGERQGWGQQPIWTHFDGYMLQRDGHRMALAGGDARFGGIFDMVGIGMSYESERVFARFAVVQRKRMAAW